MPVSIAAVALAALFSFSGQEAETPPAVEAAPGASVSPCPLPRMPEPQRPVKPTRPAVPSCVDEARGRHTCANRVIRDYETRLATYSTAFDAYVDEVNAYIGLLNGYMNEVNAYTTCEQRIVMPSRIITG